MQKQMMYILTIIFRHVASVKQIKAILLELHPVLPTRDEAFGGDKTTLEREERIQRIKRQCPDDRPAPMRDEIFQTKKQKPISKLPPGWLDCPAFGWKIGCIIPSNVPLGETFNNCVLPGKRCSFRQVLHQQRVLGRKFGMVIDLTNTSRYYSLSDWRKAGTRHVKIQCRGHDSVLDNVFVNLFVYEVSQFLARQKHVQKYILVHCTHGHNRTGFMIVHYLLRTLPISVTQVLKKISDARPPGIYKPDYIDALYAFYHEKKPEMVVYPPTPKWKRSSELNLNGDMPDDDDDGGPPAPLPVCVSARELSPLILLALYSRVKCLVIPSLLKV
ncbi:uncharacterized protein LOC132057898 [Lycium ferocissimum]|uniref:uncharacterized protein LOC132057898 n=1 Tax=Lycium ferocissimum TaxID=112874 RepID=UPI002814B56A|nr:uncharacterized protein LOC132057898 [Lycium ferocissimum]